MNGLRRFLDDNGGTVFAIVSAVASILGFVYSIQNEYTWGLIGSFATIVICAIAICWKYFNNCQALEQQLISAQATIELERTHRLEAESKLQAAGADAINELRRIVQFGSQSTILKSLLIRLDRFHRMSQLVAQESIPLTVRAIKSDHANLYVVPKCSASVAGLVRIDDQFTLSKVTTAGSRLPIGLLAASQPVNDKGTIVLQVQTVLDESEINVIAHLTSGIELKPEQLRDYRVEIDYDGNGFSTEAIDSTIKVISELAKGFEINGVY